MSNSGRIDERLTSKFEVQRGVPGTVHDGWHRLLKGMQSAGLARELPLGTVPDRLGSFAGVEPGESTIGLLFESYYRGDGNLDAALRRTRSDRHVMVRAKDGLSLRALLGFIDSVAPILGGLAVAQHRGSLRLRACRASTELNVCAEFASMERSLDADPLDEPGCERETLEIDMGRRLAAWAQKGADDEQSQVVRTHGSVDVVDEVYGVTVSVRAVFEAVNRLLEQRGARFRFLPLVQRRGVVSFAGVRAIDALVLDAAGLLLGGFEASRPFASWGSGPLITFDANDGSRVA